MRPNDIVQPTQLCMDTIYTYKAYHRGVVLSYPDRYGVVRVKWYHKKFEVPMAVRYVTVSIKVLQPA